MSPDREAVDTVDVMLKLSSGVPNAVYKTLLDVENDASTFAMWNSDRARNFGSLRSALAYVTGLDRYAARWPDLEPLAEEPSPGSGIGIVADRNSLWWRRNANSASNSWVSTDGDIWPFRRLIDELGPIVVPPTTNR